MRLRFAYPVLLLLLPLLVLGGWLLYRKSRSLARRKLALFSPAGRLANLLRTVDYRAKARKFVLVTGALCLLVLVIARPFWGPRQNSAGQTGSEFFIILDVSKSMLVRDVKPSRLAAVRASLGDWLKTRRGDRVGLILMAGDAIIQAPLTSDYTALREVLAQSGPKAISLGGTNIPAAIEVAAKALEASSVKSKAIVIISDGENLEGRPVQDVQQAHFKEKITFFTVGVGTPEGGAVPNKEESPDHKGPDGLNGPVKDLVRDEYGMPVNSRLDERNLRSIANAGGGRYFHFEPDGETWSALYGQGLAALARKSDVVNFNDYDDLFQIPLLLGILLLAWETAISTRVKNPARPVFAVTLPEPAPAPSVALTPNAKLATKRQPVVAAVLLFLILLPPPGNASPAIATGLLTTEEAEALVKSGKAGEAAERLRAAAQKNPDDLYLMYNYGVASYAAKKYSEAIDAFMEASMSREESLRSLALTQLGNAQYRLGESLQKAGNSVGATIAWERSIEYYENAVAEKSTRISKGNLGIVRGKLEKMLMAMGEYSRADASKKIGTDASVFPLSKAFEYFEKVVRLNPDNAQAKEKLEETRKLLSRQLRDRANGFSEQGAKAVQTEEERMEQQRANPKIKAESLLAAQQQRQQALYAKADETYKRAREIDPTNTALAKEHEEFKKKVGDQLTDIAAAKLEEAMNTVRPGETEAYGKQRLKQERLKAALAQIEKALSFDETNARAKTLQTEATKSLEETYVQNADASKAKADKHPDTFHEAAASEYRDALDNYQKALALNPENTHAQQALAEVEDSLARRLAEIGKQEMAKVESAGKGKTPLKPGEKRDQSGAESENADDLRKNIGHLEKAAQSFAQAEALAPGKNEAQARGQEANDQLATLRSALDQMQSKNGGPPEAGKKAGGENDKAEDSTEPAEGNSGNVAKAPLGFSEIRGGTEKEGQFRDLRKKTKVRDW